MAPYSFEQNQASEKPEAHRYPLPPPSLTQLPLTLLLFPVAHPMRSHLWMACRQFPGVCLLTRMGIVGLSTDMRRRVKTDREWGEGYKADLQMSSLPRTDGCTATVFACKDNLKKERESCKKMATATVTLPIARGQPVCLLCEDDAG